MNQVDQWINDDINVLVLWEEIVWISPHLFIHFCSESN